MLIVFASMAAASTPADVEAWLPELSDAVESGDESFLRDVFAELSTRIGDVPVSDLGEHLRTEMEGRREVECRGAICRVRWVRPDDRSSLVLHRVDGEWRLWDEAYGGHIAGPVTAQVEARGPGEVEVRINGVPTFLFEPVRNEIVTVPALDRYLSPGTNLLTLVPRGEVSVSVRVGLRSGEGPIDTTQGELVSFDGVLDAPWTFTFAVAKGPHALPK